MIHQYKLCLSYWSDGTRMQAFIHIFIVGTLAMLVSYNLDILHFNKYNLLITSNWFATYCKSLTDCCNLLY
jgi:hypothetical protein